MKHTVRNPLSFRVKASAIVLTSLLFTAELGKLSILPITNVLNNKQFGFSKLTVHNATALSMEYIQGGKEEVGDSFYLLK